MPGISPVVSIVNSALEAGADYAGTKGLTQLQAALMGAGAYTGAVQTAFETAEENPALAYAAVAGVILGAGLALGAAPSVAAIVGVLGAGGLISAAASEGGGEWFGYATESGRRRRGRSGLYSMADNITASLSFPSAADRISFAILFLPLVWAMPTTADVDLLKVRTRFGTISVMQDRGDCCTGYFGFHFQKIKIVSAGQLGASLLGVYHVREGDVVVVTVPSGGSGTGGPNYYVLLVDEHHIANIADENFESEDWPFRIVQKGNEIHFDLGFEKRLRKKAIYRNGILYVGSDLFRIENAMPKRQCAQVLDMLHDCRKMSDCSKRGISNATSMARVRLIAMLENVPVFSSENFDEACARVCASKPDNFAEPRKALCGY